MSDVKLVAFSNRGFEGELSFDGEKFDFIRQAMHIQDLRNYERVLQSYNELRPEFQKDPVFQRVVTLLRNEYENTRFVSALAFDKMLWERNRDILQERVAEFVEFMESILKGASVVVIGYEFLARRKGVTLRGRLLDTTLNPLPHLRVKAYDVYRMAPDNFLDLAFTDEEGRFEVKISDDPDRSRLHSLILKLEIQQWIPRSLRFKNLGTCKAPKGYIPEEREYNFMLDPFWKCSRKKG